MACVYPYPTRDQLLELVDQLLSKMELYEMRENLPAVIAIADADGKEKDAEQIQGFKSALKDALIHIKRNLALDIILKEEERGYQIYTSLKIVEYLTDEQKICHLSVSLKDDYGIHAAIGYGVGNHVAEAGRNAEEALKESLVVGGSFVVDEAHSLIGPLNEEHYLEVYQHDSEEIYRIARTCRLSSLTIQKLLSIMKMNGNNRMTTHELADRLGMTIRNASRILSNLEQGGAAVVVHTRAANSKGRPVKVYELHIK